MKTRFSRLTPTSPASNSGLGALDWDAVRPRMEAGLGEFHDLKMVVFEPWEVRRPGESTLQPTFPR